MAKRAAAEYVPDSDEEVEIKEKKRKGEKGELKETKSKGWAFTLNRKAKTTHEGWGNVMKMVESKLQAKSVVYAIYQMEVAPSTKQQHLQGYVLFKTAKTMAGTRSLVFKHEMLNHVHLEPAGASAAKNREYCSKPETAYVDSEGNRYMFEHGECPNEEEEKKHQGKRNDINQALATYVDQGALACLRAHPTEFVKYSRGFEKAALLVKQDMAAKMDRPVDVRIIIGPPGTGKTRLARQMSEGKTVYWAPMRSRESDSVWFDGYDGQEVLILDNFEGGAQMPWDMLLRVTDRYPYSAPCKGAHVQAAWRVIIITSSIEPESWYKKSDLESTALYRRVTNVVRLALPATHAAPVLVALPVTAPMTYEEARAKVQGDQDYEALVRAPTPELVEEEEEEPIQHPH